MPQVNYGTKELFCLIDIANVTHLLQLTKYYHEKINKKVTFYGFRW